MSEVKGRVGFGLVARAHEGRVIATKRISKTSLIDPLLAEAQGAFHAAELAADLGLRSVILEGDSSQVVKRLEQQLDRWDRVGMILSDAKLRLSSLSSWSVLSVKRMVMCNLLIILQKLASLELEEGVSALAGSPDCMQFATLS